MKKLLTVCLLVFAFFAALFALAGCGKTAPTFQGISVTAADRASFLPTETVGNAGESSKGEGEIAGDLLGAENSFDREEPFGKKIEDVLTGGMQAPEGSSDVLTVAPREKIHINIHLRNPDKAVITSVTVNGKRYASADFEDGTDAEKIVLSHEVTSEGGVLEFRVDAVTYQDGERDRDVLIGENRTALVGVAVESPISAAISEVSYGLDTLAFTVFAEDPYGLLDFSNGTLKAVVYDGAGIVAEKILSIGETAVLFEGLRPNTVYQYAVVGYYNDLSEEGFGLRMLAKDALRTESAVLFDEAVLEKDVLTFAFSRHEGWQNGEITSLALYEGDQLLRELAADAVRVDGLFGTKTYRLVAEYAFGGKTESISLSVKVRQKQKPDFTMTTMTKETDSTYFALNITDPDGAGEVTKAVLSWGSESMLLENTTEYLLTGLLSDMRYTVRITYTYDLNDGNGPQEIEKVQSVVTLKKTAPQVRHKGTTTCDSAEGEFFFEDKDRTLVSYRMELYRKNQLVAESGLGPYRFTGLEYYAGYSLELFYVYDMNDGQGEQTGTYGINFRTQPYIEITKFTAEQDGPIFPGETIRFSAELENPSELRVQYITVSGQIYPVTSDSTLKKIYVEIPYDPRYVTGGKDGLELEQLTVRDHYQVTASKDKWMIPVTLVGDLSVEKIEFVNQSFVPIEWGTPAEKVYVLITLDNYLGYTLDSVIVNGKAVTELHRVTKNRWYYEIDPSLGWNFQTLSTVTYHLDSYQGSSPVGMGKSAQYYKVASEEPQYITEAQDLLHMNGGLLYVLQNDIDLAGMDWVPSDFDGILQGNGHVIRNLTASYREGVVYGGLFANASGFVEDLLLEGVQIEAVPEAVDGVRDATFLEAYVYCGALAGRVADGGFLDLRNCHVDETSFLHATAKDTVYVGGLVGYGRVNASNCSGGAQILAETYSASTSVIAGGLFGAIPSYGGAILQITDCVHTGAVYGVASAPAPEGRLLAFCGGIVGSLERVEVRRCANRGSVSAVAMILDASTLASLGANAAYAEAGGIAGRGINIAVADCINTGEISAGGTADLLRQYSVAIGGIVGYAKGGEGIQSSINFGVVAAISAYVYKAYVGGIAGITESAVQGCLNIGDIGAIGIFDTRYCIVGGTAGDVWTEGTVERCYSRVSANGENGGICDSSMWNSKEFYTGVLGWSEKVWDLSSLDLENGKGPELK